MTQKPLDGGGGTNDTPIQQATDDMPVCYVPPAEYNREVIQHLALFDDLLRTQSERVIQFLQGHKEQEENSTMPSVVVIQGGRYELFLQTGRNSCFRKLICVFQVELQLEPFKDVEEAEDIKEAETNTAKVYAEMLRKYAETQARKDDRVECMGIRNFHGFSLIISFGPQNAQAPHIDLKEGGLVFLMMISDKAPATLIYPGHDEFRSSGDFMKKIVGLAPRDQLYKILGRAIKDSADATSLLHDYGQVLFLCDKSKDGRKSEICSYPHGVRRGAVLSIPGGLPHAAPVSAGYRAAVFFTGTPGGAEEYDSDMQYSAVIVYVELLRHLWPHLTKASKCKEVLLGTVPHLVKNETRYRQFWKHIYYREMSKWIFELETNHDKCKFGAWMERIGKLADATDLFKEMTKQQMEAHCRTLAARK
jgi:hypothetical protein